MFQEVETGSSHKVTIVKQRSVDMETCQRRGDGTLNHQGVNNQREPPDTARHVMEASYTRAAKSWEGKYEGTEDLTLSRFWEMEQGQVSDVQGRLKTCLSFWENTLQPAPWIVSCIKEGYKLPLSSLPKSYSQPNQALALANKKFVTQALSELVKNHCVVKVPSQPQVCSPLSVVSNSAGKQRLVINLHYLNGHL